MSAPEAPHRHCPPVAIYELPRALHHRAAPLFSDLWFDEALIQAVFQGKQRGRIFADHLHAPRAALLCRPYGYYLGGDAASTGLRSFVADAPGEAGMFHALYGYMVDDAWCQALIEDRPTGLRIVDRKSFVFPPDATRRGTATPPGATVKRLDRILAVRADGELHAGIGVTWGSYASFLEGGFGYCTMLHGTMASVAYTIAVSDRTANISVDTAAPYRRLGLSLLTSTAYIDHCLSQGLQPTWDTDRANIASIRTALALGFVEDRPFFQVSPSSNAGARGANGSAHVSRGSWRAGTPLPSSPPGLVVWHSVPEMD